MSGILLTQSSSCRQTVNGYKQQLFEAGWANVGHETYFKSKNGHSKSLLVFKHRGKTLSF